MYGYQQQPATRQPGRDPGQWVNRHSGALGLAAAGGVVAVCGGLLASGTGNTMRVFWGVALLAGLCWLGAVTRYLYDRRG